MRVFPASCAALVLTSACAIQAPAPGGGTRTVLIGIGVLDRPAAGEGDVEAGRLEALGLELRLQGTPTRGPGFSLGYISQDWLVAPLDGEGAVELRRGAGGEMRLERIAVDDAGDAGDVDDVGDPDDVQDEGEAE
ncbi:hypothetical protein ACQ5SO_14950 [Rhodovulum sp. DZ06]|uniref:hypothetical protein n=1 Tax=Rhodovulum sp. DZ06 TaxID=3425126 RepID=UPI003D34781B